MIDLHQKDKDIEYNESLMVGGEMGCFFIGVKCTYYNVYAINCSLAIPVASFPGPRLFQWHEGKSQGLVSKVT